MGDNEKERGRERRIYKKWNSEKIDRVIPIGEGSRTRYM